MKLNEAARNILSGPIKKSTKPAPTVRQVLKEDNLNPEVDQAIDLFQEFDAEQAEAFFNRLSDFYSHGSDTEDDHYDFKAIESLLRKAADIIKNRKGN